MADTTGNVPSPDEFLVRLREVPWFADIGRPMPAVSRVERIERWEEWPGPEEESVAILHEKHQALYDSIIEAAGPSRDRLLAMWDRIHFLVFEVAAPRVPYDPDQDSWHGPSAAVWQAAWTAGLVGLCLLSTRPVPPALQEQWGWFMRGRWPCGYASVGPNGTVGPLVVY